MARWIGFLPFVGYLVVLILALMAPRGSWLQTAVFVVMGAAILAAAVGHFRRRRREERGDEE